MFGTFSKSIRGRSWRAKVVRLDGKVLWDGNGIDKQEVKEEEKFNGRPEIDRRALMKLLFESLDPD